MIQDEEKTLNKPRIDHVRTLNIREFENQTNKKKTKLEVWRRRRVITRAGGGAG